MTKRLANVAPVPFDVPAFPPRPILVADPDMDTRAAYGLTLRVVGREVVEAADGCDALIHALARPPALAILEMRLPLIDGEALCEILRRDEATRVVPILVVTGESREPRLQRIRAAGADEVLVKPASREIVLNEVQRLISVAREVDPLVRGRPERGVPGTGHEHPLPRLEPSRRPALVAVHQRFASRTPPAAPPPLRCPSCDRPLVYDVSHIGGVNEHQSEQWDYYRCRSCGHFQYRHRTRRLRRLP